MSRVFITGSADGLEKWPPSCLLRRGIVCCCTLATRSAPETRLLQDPGRKPRSQETYVVSRRLVPIAEHFNRLGGCRHPERRCRLPAEQADKDNRWFTARFCHKYLSALHPNGAHPPAKASCLYQLRVTPGRKHDPRNPVVCGVLR